jgi:hypothetical protein
VLNAGYRPGSGTPGQRCSIVNRGAIATLPAAGLFGYNHSLVLYEILRRHADIPSNLAQQNW